MAKYNEVMSRVAVTPEMREEKNRLQMERKQTIEELRIFLSIREKKRSRRPLTAGMKIPGRRSPGPSSAGSPWRLPPAWS